MSIYPPYSFRYPHFLYNNYSRSPYYLNRPYLEEYDSDFYRNRFSKPSIFQRDFAYERALRWLRWFAFVQIFVAGVMLVADISKVVLLWAFVQHSDLKLQLLSSLPYAVFSVILGFACLSGVLTPSRALSQFLLLLVLTALVPLMVLPSHSPLLSSAMEALEVSRVMSELSSPHKVDWMPPQEMIKSEAQNRAIRLLRTQQISYRMHPLGIQDLSLVSSELLHTVQLLLITFSIFSVLHIFMLLVTVICLLRLLSLQ